MTTTETIINVIKDQIRPAMDVWEDDMYNFIKDLQEYCTKTVYNDYEDQKGSFNLMGNYTANESKSYIIHILKERNGYKKTYERFFHRSETDKKDMIHKEASHKLNKIDVAVKKKLNGVDIEKIEMLGFNAYSANGFCDGAWKINDNKVFSFRGIYAGGYNIQCHHVRTLYTYK